MHAPDRKDFLIPEYFEKEHELRHLEVIFKDCFLIQNFPLALFLKIVLAKSWSMFGKVQEKKTGTSKLNY